MPSVAEILVEGLLKAGVPRLFGVPGGGSNLDMLEAARARGLPFVLCHQEWAACIMAAVTGELTGAPGAAISTLGPGVTASVTGLAHAVLDRAPMIYVSDRHPAAALDFTTHQRVDHAALLAPIVKESLPVSADAASHRVAHAAQLALKDPRGPVHLDLPADVAGQPALPVAVDPVPASLPPPEAGALDRAAELIRGARRPLVLAGLQCRPADAKWLRAFCEALPAPVLTTYKAKGALPDPHPLAMGVFTGGVIEEPVVRRADLIIAFGLDTVELIPRRWPYSAPVLSLARCASSEPALRAPGGGRYFTPVHEVVGDLGGILEELAPRLMRPGAQADWDVAEVDRLRRERQHALAVAVPGLAPHRVVQLARELTPAGTIATVDAGAHMFPATAYWLAVELGECLISNGLATMGFALPAAIAAQLVYPERRVICFTGDGGLMMVAAELETAARLGLPIIVVVFDDMALSLIEVKQEQRGFAGASMRYAGPDLVALGRAFGIRAYTADDEAGLRAALLAALAGRGPALVDARIDASGYRRILEVVRGPVPSPPPGERAR
jgi:acetolactate synthase-1/2/3 large subunit